MRSNNKWLKGLLSLSIVVVVITSFHLHRIANRWMPPPDAVMMVEESRHHHHHGPQTKSKSIPKKTPTTTTTTTTASSTTKKKRNQKVEGKNDKSHKVAGLNCDKYGGPSEEDAAEMVYWSDIPSDANVTSPYASRYQYGRPLSSPKYLTFEPDEGGWNNIRMSMETATAMAHAMGRILVLPPAQPIYLLGNDNKHRNNRFTFQDFFHFDSIAEEHPAVNVISMKEFLEREAMTGQLQDRNTKSITFPPENKTERGDYDGSGARDNSWSWLQKEKKFWHWLRNATSAPIWNFDECVVAIGKEPGEEGANKWKQYRKMLQKAKWSPSDYNDKATPVDAPPEERLKEILGPRRKLCVYGDTLQNARVIHFMGDNASGARLLTHFYAFLFFEDWHQDLWTKRFVRDHLRYVDDIQCAAARVVNAVREKAREHGDPDGKFDSFHIRRGDFQYKETRIEAQEIYENVKDVLVENSTVFIATDERNLAFFEPLRKHHHIYFLHDFQHLIGKVNKNYYGMLDQRIASRGRTFVGAFYSTFTGYINRMRGYHSQKDKLPGYKKGGISSYFYAPTKVKNEMIFYRSLKQPFWSREFPVAWRDIDHDISKDVVGFE